MAVYRRTLTQALLLRTQPRSQGCYGPTESYLGLRRHSLDENLGAKEGGREKTGAAHFSPSHDPLRFVTSHPGFFVRVVQYRPDESRICPFATLLKHVKGKWLWFNTRATSD